MTLNELIEELDVQYSSDIADVKSIDDLLAAKAHREVVEFIKMIFKENGDGHKAITK